MTLYAIYGTAGAFWRGRLLGLLSDDVDDNRFLLDGLCVDAPARSQGLGTALLEAICAEAKHRGYTEVRLDVDRQQLARHRPLQTSGF